MRNPLIFMVLASALPLAACSSANFALKEVGPSCKALYDGNLPVTRPRPKGGTSVFAVGDNCPKTLPEDANVYTWPQRSIESGGHMVRVVGLPDKEGKVRVTTIRRNEGGHGRKPKGQYLFFRAQ